MRVSELAGQRRNVRDGSTELVYVAQIEFADVTERRLQRRRVRRGVSQGGSQAPQWLAFQTAMQSASSEKNVATTAA